MQSIPSPFHPDAVDRSLVDATVLKVLEKIITENALLSSSSSTRKWRVKREASELVHRLMVNYVDLLLRMARQLDEPLENDARQWQRVERGWKRKPMKRKREPRKLTVSDLEDVVGYYETMCIDQGFNPNRPVPGARSDKRRRLDE